MRPQRKQNRRSLSRACFLLLILSGLCGCRQKVEIAPPIETNILLSQYGLPTNYAKYDEDYCTGHVIGYRSLFWLTDNSVVVVFNTSPSCRASSDQRVAKGNARLLVFDVTGHLKASRDVPYVADGGDEIVAPGEVFRGPEDTVVFRIEEAGGVSQSGILVFDASLRDVAHVDRFMEAPSTIDRSLVFQQGLVSSGPRTYDVLKKPDIHETKSVTADVPPGTMDRRVGGNGFVYAECEQELKPNEYEKTNIVYSGARRRCTLRVQPASGDPWSTVLNQNELVEILGIDSEYSVYGIVRRFDQADQLERFSKSSPPKLLPWFGRGYESKFVGGNDTMTRYLGYGEPRENKVCSVLGIFCGSAGKKRLLVTGFDQQQPLVEKTISTGDEAALSPDGSRYATFESGKLLISSLRGR